MRYVAYLPFTKMSNLVSGQYFDVFVRSHPPVATPGTCLQSVPDQSNKQSDVEPSGHLDRYNGSTNDIRLKVKNNHVGNLFYKYSCDNEF